MKEDLLLTFTRMSIIMISVMIGLLHFLSPGKHSTSYYICLGEDPGIDPYDYGKVSSIVTLTKYINKFVLLGSLDHNSIFAVYDCISNLFLQNLLQKFNSISK